MRRASEVHNGTKLPPQQLPPPSPPPLPPSTPGNMRLWLPSSALGGLCLVCVDLAHYTAKTSSSLAEQCRALEIAPCMLVSFEEITMCCERFATACRAPSSYLVILQKCVL